MIDVGDIRIEKIASSRIAELDMEKIPFGKVFSDHMFIVDYREGAWINPRIKPYKKLAMSPASPAIHYGQSIFEGIKAYKNEKNEVMLFRPTAHLKRMNRSAQRMCMPALPEALFIEGMCELINLDRDWVPSEEKKSLYIRPFMFSCDESIGIRPSKNFRFMIITCPVRYYYENPVKVRIESHYTRAIAGGVGYIKAGGNYGGAIYPAKLAQDMGYDQLIWTDGKEHKYIEESGTMNVMFVFGDTLVTPPLSDSILGGITRDSVLTLARHWGIKVEERKVTVNELIDKLQKGQVKDAFGTGTAATIAHIDLIGHEGKDYRLPPIAERTLSTRILNELRRIKRGTGADLFEWVRKV